ncbi:unnamed protein product [Rhizophagus irregularis]|uniref:Uncharacterized protein n=1 Tax=Rhizophagus irregularis TaxID=588596 RepID=A0A916EIC7_9GLOM|nr:unnamed protein product [Rhizophagus irregularis]
MKGNARRLDDGIEMNRYTLGSFRYWISVPVLQDSETENVPVLQDSETKNVPVLQDSETENVPVLQDSETENVPVLQERSSAPGFRNGKMSPSQVSLESENDSSGILDFDRFWESD